MTQVESIRQNIHGAKLAISAARKIVCKSGIQKLHVESYIEYHLNQLKELRFSLNCAQSTRLTDEA